MTDSAPPPTLGSLRATAADVDSRILKLLEERARLAKSVREHHPGQVLVPGSRSDWLELLDGMSAGDLPVDSVRTIFSHVAAACAGLEQALTVAYLGPEGSFCHQAAIGYFGESAAYVRSERAHTALEEVQRGRCTHAIFPMESSNSGMIRGAIAALAQTEPVLVAAVSERAVYSLMNRTGNHGDVEKIFVTARARGRCQAFVKSLGARVSLLDVKSPSEAVELALDDHGAGAVVPEAYGRTQGLSACQSHVGDSAEQQYRYGIASTRLASRTGHDTTALLCSIDDAPGTLYQVLSQFSERGINLLKLQSQPLPGARWDYVFYLELGGHISDRAVVTAIEAVKKLTKYLKVVGAFPSPA